ncbi:MAG: dipeptidyl aminopeptidase [Ignavibacteriae bacterium]|nr:dipeptidyl aminopeptidase [Ignavibacteriota bacterium]
MKKFLFLILIITGSLFAQEKRAITVDDLWEMKRIGSFDVNSKLGLIVFDVTSFDMAANKGNSDIYMINIDGTNLKPFKNTNKNESSPNFTPTGNKITFEKEGQVWICDLDGSNEKKLTDLYTGASGIVWTNDESKFLFTSSVYPECMTQECNEEKDKLAEENPVKAKVFTELMYRHWNSWRGEKRSHLFLMDVEHNKYFDLTVGSKSDVPPIALGGYSDYSISSDGNYAAFTTNLDKNLAWSTNNDVFLVELNNVKEKYETPKRKISESLGNDNQPIFSPNGKLVAFISMERAGFEADKKRLFIYDIESKTSKNLTEDYDLSVGEVIWSPDSKSIYFTAANQVYQSIYKIDIETAELKTIIEENYNSGIKLSADGNTIYFKKQKSNLPYEIFSVNSDGTGLKQISEVNKNLLAQLEMNNIETFWSEGAEGAKVQSILIKPPFFKSNKKYPMIFLIHGGPQGNWADDFHYRWNMQMFAAKGYVVVAPNPRGSTGYGQKFTDEISTDWGGKVYTDLMNAYDYAIENYSFIDGQNTFAAGASYGGYMINWLSTQTDRFNALVSHCGVWNLESMYGATEEIWFPEWEFGGAPWENRELYQKWSPHQFAENIKTPMLVVHGANDFRVPEGQAFELFTTLQRLGVESKFLYFPDEYHFVTKPQNAKLWWNTIYDWFNNHYLRK